MENLIAGSGRKLFCFPHLSAKKYQYRKKLREQAYDAFIRQKTNRPNSLVATNGIIDNSNDPTISNLSATFTEPGQTAVYKFYAYNAGELNSFLKRIVFENVTVQNATKVCTASAGTTDELVQKACEKISVKVKVGNEFETSTGKTSITGHSLAKKNGEAVVATLEYEAGANRADGNFNVAFGNITLNYSSAD